LPRYFFHIHNHIETHDEEGLELPDLQSARAMAIKAARAMMAENVVDGRLWLDHWVEVENEAGQQVLAIKFGDAVEITP
jgi:hypothetical protein